VIDRDIIINQQRVSIEVFRLMLNFNKGNLMNPARQLKFHHVYPTNQHVYCRLEDKAPFRHVEDERLKWLAKDFLDYLKCRGMLSSNPEDSEDSAYASVHGNVPIVQEKMDKLLIQDAPVQNQKIEAASALVPLLEEEQEVLDELNSYPSINFLKIIKS